MNTQSMNLCGYKIFSSVEVFLITRVIKGDAVSLFKSGEFDVFAHGCNCFCTMGKGIAKQVKDQLRPLFDSDLKFGRKGSRLKLGTFTTHEFDFGVGVNLYTQYTFWDVNDMLDYGAIEDCSVV
ncbi:hypothetical protein LAh9_72 [Aeromonas phage LAh_9]|uniref:Uncharacterized protein n=2 Tax=Lahexavirus TaxID=2843411 RepID=A0A514A0Y3_9CAUD|nr:hypothetical protein HWC30_gp097 [Aeromonas phage LAh_6]YP_009847553.1 hypothetical protein HWC32_gp072 [Aeromonas phage LAh_9]QDH46560.1 hypothetical protein LAh6_97 [Aeromonas phage LAh_6]QDH46938.1 hypothetical protein LAh9_72 [Aeromonas phage LAh_9]